MSDNDQHSYKGLPHKTLISMTGSEIEKAAAQQGLNDQVLREEPKQVIEEIKEPEPVKQNPVPLPEVRQRGRIVLFKPTKERVTITKEKIGRTYNGIWIHEVTTRDGNQFLASVTQLADLV